VTRASAETLANPEETVGGAIGTTLADHDVELVHDDARWPIGTPVAFREAYLLPLRAFLPSQGLAETSTLVLVAPALSGASDGRVVAPRLGASGLGASGQGSGQGAPHQGSRPAPRRRVVLTSDAALYQQAIEKPKAGLLVLSPKEAIVVAMAGEAGVLPPDADSQWTTARARAAARGEAWRLDLATVGLGRAFRTRADADAALATPLHGLALPELWWEGDPELCPGHWLLYGWTVGRLAAAWGLSLERVIVAGQTVAQGEVAVSRERSAA
jgi:hypothetical protein